MKRFFRFILKGIGWFVVLTVLWVLLYGALPVPYTPLMGIRAISAGKEVQTRHDWVPLTQISPYLQLAVICSEDQNFTKHNGFDVESIKKAYENNKKGKKIKGGSTISQQTAKNVFLWPHRNWFRKGMETYFTFLIETFWTKERILEVYLNSIEMGKGVYGAEAAAQYWYHKPANKLGREEAAAIAAILPNPQNYKANPRSRYIQNRTAWIVKQMRNYGTFDLKEKDSE
ncbi:MAG: monofunctional biosynthetic peptidoglycan transglycosylase [Altibacter sp.]|uniref:monofunctional biosynthetic peptidoglycan transglycosylase n=1 Tax=Altibacter sp. TaxID=2024823 RepID=UPI000C946655|nr:monofunctional biosynthetic peptidoglycan transglycosylase [Altibacter sp.]MAP55710.1 monofunctional biosynthetic peptidoglycan transglycosylase [Altibacter sp.]